LRAVGYLRASKDEQKLTAEAQQAAIEAWAASAGVTVVSSHVDQGVCSVTPIEQRPALGAALASLREQNAGVLVVAKRDRIARDVMLTAMVERAATAVGAVVVSAAGEGNGATPADQFMRTVIDGAAQYERALIRTRTKAALAVKRSRGESTGNALYGFHLGEDGKRLIADPYEHAVLEELRALRASGASYRDVRRHATDRGLVGRTGHPFTLQAVFTMVCWASRGSRGTGDGREPARYAVPRAAERDQA
jgi:DNA invertase Pin-like site-specific DNA recombinase